MIQVLREYLKKITESLPRKKSRQKNFVKYYWLTLVGILGGSMLMISCTPDYNSETYLTEVLVPQECNLPCWRGIVPEESSREDLLDVLEQLSDNKVEKFQQTNTPNFGIQLWWQDDSVGSSYNALFQENTLKYIESQPLFDITLNDLVSVIDTPQHYIAKLATGERTVLYVDLFYEDIGVYVFLWDTSPDETLIRNLKSCEVPVPSDITIEYLRIMSAQTAESMMEKIPTLKDNYTVDNLRTWSDEMYLSACQR